MDRDHARLALLGATAAGLAVAGLQEDRQLRRARGARDTGSVRGFANEGRRAESPDVAVFHDASTGRVARITRDGAYLDVAFGRGTPKKFLPKGMVRAKDPSRAQKLAVGWVYNGVDPRTLQRGRRARRTGSPNIWWPRVNVGSGRTVYLTNIRLLATGRFAAEGYLRFPAPSGQSEPFQSFTANLRLSRGKLHATTIRLKAAAKVYDDPGVLVEQVSAGLQDKRVAAAVQQHYPKSTKLAAASRGYQGGLKMASLPTVRRYATVKDLPMFHSISGDQFSLTAPQRTAQAAEVEGKRAARAGSDWSSSANLVGLVRFDDTGQWAGVISSYHSFS